MKKKFQGQSNHKTIKQVIKYLICNNFLAFAAKNNEIAFDDLRIDLASAESLEKEVEEA